MTDAQMHQTIDKMNITEAEREIIRQRIKHGDGNAKFVVYHRWYWNTKQLKSY